LAFIFAFLCVKKRNCALGDRKMLRKIIAIAAMAGALAACEGGPTPYQPGGDGARG
jgi:hypothetical protein